MCGRFTLTLEPTALAEAFAVPQTPPPDWRSRYNIAPTQTIAAVIQTSSRQFMALRWGLIPAWAKDPRLGARLINARAETLADKPAFRAALARRRCLILADGFYEWAALGRVRQAHYFQLADGAPFAFAGLWENWLAPEGQFISSGAIITTTPNALVAPIHDRMPAILAPEDYDAWLSPEPLPPPALTALLRPYPAAAMRQRAVSARVNRASYDAPDCLN
jgi:putative SOS response-associated peptidase YedK